MGEFRRIGTAHFESFRAACRYYRAYGFKRDDVKHKLDEGEIHLGPPAPWPDSRVRIDPKERRYYHHVDAREHPAD